jgi:hypothetical protein
VSPGIANVMDFLSFVAASGWHRLRTFNGLDVSVMVSSCSNLRKLTVP